MAFFISPKILFGKSSLKQLGSELAGRKGKAAIITDKTMVEQVSPLREALQASGLEVEIWDGAEPEPSIEIATDGSEFLGEVSPEWVVAFGGGSAIDTAKASWILYERPDLKAEELSRSINPKVKLNLRRKALFLAVPTTSGTGSEVTWAVVLTDKEKGRKVAFANSEIVPDLALLVPEFTAKMPPSVTASTGLDVLGHALDGFTARQQTDFSDGLCLEAARICFEWLPRAFQNGENMQAREKMQNAAAIAGIGFGNSNTSLCHALAHSIGAVFKISHGRSVGLALPYSLEYIASNPILPGAPEPVKRLATVARFVGIEESSDSNAIALLLEKIKQLQRDIQEPVTLGEAGISKSQFDSHINQLALAAEKDINMYSSPCECKGETMKKLIQKMWDGR